MPIYPKSQQTVIRSLSAVHLLPDLGGFDVEIFRITRS